MERFNALGATLASFGAFLALASHLIISNIPLTALGIGILILGLSMFLTPTEPIPKKAVRSLLEGSALSLEALLEEFDATNRGYYIQHEDGRIYVQIPLANDRGPINPNPSTGSIITEKDGEPYLIVLPPASELVRTGGLPESLEAALTEALVEVTELCESVEVAVGEGINLRVRGARGWLGAGRFKRVLGSQEASLAACIAAATLKQPIRVVSEEDEGRGRRITLEVIK
ncbi:MAG: hypothetical protein QW638_08665 [Candidatus Bathyarchaeia archaeon]